jgi:hypothetical protein
MGIKGWFVRVGPARDLLKGSEGSSEPPSLLVYHVAGQKKQNTLSCILKSIIVYFNKDHFYFIFYWALGGQCEKTSS